MNSRDKGKRGELELAAFLRERGIEARRGGQTGNPGAHHRDDRAGAGVAHVTGLSAWWRRGPRRRGSGGIRDRR